MARPPCYLRWVRARSPKPNSLSHKTIHGLAVDGPRSEFPGHGYEGDGQAGRPLGSRVDGYRVRAVFPRGVGKPAAGCAIYATDPQVEGGGQQGPFGSDVANTPQQEPSHPSLLFDDPEDGFDQVLSPFERRTGLLCVHSGAMTAQGSVIGAYRQAPFGGATGEARSSNRTLLASILGDLVHSLVHFPGEPAAYQGQHLSLGTSVDVAVLVVGEPVLVVGMVQRHSPGRLRHRHLLAGVSTFL